MSEGKHTSVSTYVIVALILGVITYVEFALVEYPQAWLGSGWTIFLLVALSIVKFVMVVMFFMHLKDDDRTYSGFFSSGMFIALATFVGLTAMFILPKAVASTRPDNRAAQEASHAVPHELLDNVETRGASRAPAEIADTPAVADRSVSVEAPTAPNDASTYSVTPPAGATAQGGAATAEEPAATEAPAAEATGAQSAAGEAAEAEEPAAQEATAEEAEEAPAQAEAPTAEEPAAAAVSWDKDHGAAVFNANCMACHQMTGQGIPGAFPPLASHAVEVYAVAGGRDYLADAVIFGLQGAINVNGMTYNGVMPAWGHLADADLADALNHVLTAWDDEPAGFQPYTAADIAARRPDGLSAGDVHAKREALGLH
ncbi:MAG: cytochrome C oxidase subunit IV family protein [Trueperaceae bacterium]|nr:cytochrome C oxidase subunit IV family protein [Trueperaceae bacterium]MCC6310260.1 cytochrome C oxidase subunit IV family protein [Trueperaceae bacterium]MCO5173260.1 cytochrome C oxidase subunit IV family protein [Trueperaceae bacterium]MCW5818709.1 cytochrome C oxidase subunit IV family protein [Trueperaceae bacterium]